MSPRSRSGGLLGRLALLTSASRVEPEVFPEKMRQMGECAQADYQARFVADWGWQRLCGERRKQARLHR